jgi:ABC-type Fe3+ transport system permease subunit
LLISIAMTATTLTVMVGLVWLAMHGLMRLKLHWLEHHEGLAVGGILVALGLLLLFQEGFHLH